MGTRIGVIAGRGKFLSLALDEARKKGYTFMVAGIKGEAEPSLEKKAEAFQWIGADEVFKLISFFRKHSIDEAVMLGKVNQSFLYRKKLSNRPAQNLLAQVKEKSPSALIQAIIEFLASQGIKVKDPSLFLAPYFCAEGILTEKVPPGWVMEDIDFGWRIAKNIADLDIGQTVVVKDKSVVAVEGLEGTDEAIKRAGRLAGKGIVAVKVSRSSQDPRIDLPAVGLDTLRCLVRVKGVALCFEARGVPFFQKEKALSLANAHGVAIVAKNS